LACEGARALGADCARRFSAAALDLPTGQRAVALDGELHEDLSTRSLALDPRPADALDHREEVVGTAEVGDVERRSGAGAAAARQSEAHAARTGVGDRTAGARPRAPRPRAAPRLRR